jgi:hypothetical protein
MSRARRGRRRCLPARALRTWCWTTRVPVSSAARATDALQAQSVGAGLTELIGPEHSHATITAAVEGRAVDSRSQTMARSADGVRDRRSTPTDDGQ